MDEVGELLAVAGAAARIGVEHDITQGGPDLLFEIEAIAVIAEGSAVNFENKRVFLRGVEARRLNNPALNFALVLAEAYQISSTWPGIFCCKSSWLTAVRTRIAPLVETAMSPGLSGRP